ncbi:DUF2946 domain-containing protein [Undibacterium sp.]|uniref:DUF2946 domain-containing protein n=1 Tax=Undibacterium sp. TaxID=1914977 RepID=UPI0039C93D92
MNFKRASKRTLVAWLTMFAMLLQALMPTISHAGANRFSNNLAEVCTSSGVQSVTLASGNKSSSPAKNDHGNHCYSCCCLGDAPLPALLSTGYFLATTIGRTEFSEPISNSSNTTSILAAHPRGPPAIRL